MYFKALQNYGAKPIQSKDSQTITPAIFFTKPSNKEQNVFNKTNTISKWGRGDLYAYSLFDAKTVVSLFLFYFVFRVSKYVVEILLCIYLY